MDISTWPYDGYDNYSYNKCWLVGHSFSVWQAVAQAVNCAPLGPAYLWLNNSAVAIPGWAARITLNPERDSFWDVFS